MVSPISWAASRRVTRRRSRRFTRRPARNSTGSSPVFFPEATPPPTRFRRLCAHLGKGRRFRPRQGLPARVDGDHRPQSRPRRGPAGSSRVAQDLPESFEPAADEVDPLAARERSEGLVKLLNCLQAQDEEKRAVVLLAYYRGLSREALALRFGRPVPTIKTWLHRSLAQLRACLAS